MRLIHWIKTRRKQKFYLKQDFRIMKNSLMMWDNASHSWESKLEGLPNYSFGRTRVLLVYMTGHNDLMFALLLRSNPMDFFATPAVYLTMVFYNASKGFWMEHFHDMVSLKNRIGAKNYEFFRTKAAVDFDKICIA